MPQGPNGFPNILQLVRTTSLWVVGKTGATAGAGLAGGTPSGAPTTGQFTAGEAVVAANGHLWICTASGTPGTWVDAGSAGAYTDPLTTKGDLVAFGASTTRQAVGTDTYVLTADSTQSTGMKWAAPSATSGVKQIVRAAQSSDNSNIGSSAAYTAYPNLSQAITIAAGSSILARVSGTLLHTTSSSWCSFKLVIGSQTTGLGAVGFPGSNTYATIAGEDILANPGAGAYTVSLTYKTSAASGLYCRPSNQVAFENLQIVLVEYA